MSPRFFSATTPPTLELPVSITADAGVATHLRVLRMRENDEITLFDGSGQEWSARIERIEKRDIRLAIESVDRVSRESPLQITLVQSLASAEKMDWIVQKATELGATRVVPVRTARSTLKLDADRAAKKLEHWRGVAIAASEQCGRNTLLEVDPVIDLNDWLKQPSTGLRLALHPLATISPRAILSPETKSLSIVIGPEGGFDADEAQRLSANCGMIKLGPRVLRTETAGLAAISLFQGICGDFF
jgi:16S rRNA (uracil1498-N3)-methyltransferase